MEHYLFEVIVNPRVTSAHEFFKAVNRLKDHQSFPKIDFVGEYICIYFDRKKNSKYFG